MKPLRLFPSLEIISIVQFFTVMCLTGCMTSPLTVSSFQSFSPEEGIAFGRVKLTEGETVRNLSFLRESKFGLFITSEDSSESMYVPLKDDGTFYWHLPAGIYTIASFEWRSNITLSGRIFAKFKVAEKKATYIGTLAIQLHGSRYVIEIRDDYDSSSNSALEKFPLLKGALTKNLMLTEDRR